MSYIQNLSKENIKKLKKFEIVSYLAEYNLDTSGKRNEIESRLVNFIQEKHDLYHHNDNIEPNEIKNDGEYDPVYSSAGKLSILEVELELRYQYGVEQCGVELQTNRLFKKLENDKWTMLDLILDFKKSKVLKLI